MVIDFAISPQDACVQGHFPGAPLVPGAYLLGFIDTLLGEHFPEYELVGFGKVKFLAPLLPGHSASLHLEPVAHAKTQVRITCRGELLLVASALLRPVQS